MPRFVVSLHRSRGFAIRGQEQPVEEGLLEEPHHHLYSSFKDEAEMPGMANLDSIWGEVMAEPVPPLQGHQSTTNEQGQCRWKETTDHRSAGAENRTAPLAA